MPKATGKSEGTPLSEVLTSPISAEKLESSGFRTVEELREKAPQMGSLLKLGLGEVTMEEIARVMDGVVGSSALPEEIIEAVADIHITSPYQGYSLQIVPGGVEKNENGKGYRTTQPLYLVCEKGRGRFTRRMWYLRKYGRDRMREVEQAERDNEPWRIEAHQWLQKRKAYNTDFRIMSD